MLNYNNKQQQTNQEKSQNFSSFPFIPYFPLSPQKPKPKTLGVLASNFVSKNKLKFKYSVNKEPSETIKENIYETVDNLSSAQRDVLYEIYYYLLRHANVYVSQDTIAKKLDLSREHVNRSIRVLTDMGFIAKEFRGIKQTCLYKFTSYFSIKENARKIIQLLSPARILSIALLMSMRVPYNNESMDIVTQYKKRNMNNIISSIYTPSETIKELQKKYNLSQTGVIKLMVFPDQALKNVIDQMNGLGSQPKDPIAYIIFQLKDYCKANNIKPNWTIFYKLMEMNNLPKSSDNYLPKDLAVDVITDRENMSVMYADETSSFSKPNPKPNSSYVHNGQSKRHESQKVEVDKSRPKLQSYIPYIHKKIELDYELEAKKLEAEKDKFISNLKSFMSISEAESIFNNLQKREKYA